VQYDVIKRTGPVVSEKKLVNGVVVEIEEVVIGHRHHPLGRGVIVAVRSVLD